jgi:TolB-like protein/Flp pilus assembly protein TadD
MRSEVDIRAIEEELDHVLASKVFLPAQRSQSFLRYIVGRSLLGAQAKEYEIAVDVFGRGADYDPSIDAMVRVEAGRLRHRLREYYDTVGVADPILIEIPKGGYTATFILRETQLDSQGRERARVSPESENKDQTAPLRLDGSGSMEAGRNGAARALDGGKRSHSEEPPTFRLTMRWALLILGAGTIAVAIAATVFRFNSKRLHEESPIRSLAVLPLENLSGDPGQEYFADGITDELITELAHIPNLRVVSRTSVMQDKGNKKPLRQIAKELSVDAIVEGSVVRSGDRVRVTAQLIDARDDRHLWAQSYEEQMSDMLALQDKLVREIASQTQTALALPEANHSPARTNPKAYDAYLRGLYFLHRREAPKSVEYFQEAISVDSSYAAAYAGLAEALVSEARSGGGNAADPATQALASAQRAIQLDPDNGDAYAALGLIEITKRDWTAAGRDLKKAIQLSPGNSFAELQYAIYIDAVGQPQEAVTHMRQALRLDPLSFYMNRHLGSVLYLARNYDEALFYLHRAIEMEPDQPGAVEGWASRSYEKSGRLQEAVQADLRSLGGSISPASLEPLRLAWQEGGWRPYQAARVKLLAERASEGCDYYEVGESYLRLGDHDQAVRWITRGMDEYCFWADFIQVNPVLDDLRRDARYPGLVRRMHLQENLY